MTDRLVSVLRQFRLEARVGHTGSLTRPARYAGPADASAGHIHVLRAGRVRLQVAGRQAVTLAEPSVVFLPRPVEHRLEPIARHPADLVCAEIEFGARLHNPLTRAVPLSTVAPLTRHGALADAVSLLFVEAAEVHCGRQAVLDRVCEVVVILLLRHLMDAALVESGVLAGLTDPRLRHALLALHEAPAEPWTLARLARLAGMSRARFAQHFRDVVGQTPGSYLTDWRLALAQKELRGGASVKQVALAVGYESASALARVFSARLKVSPSQWARRATGSNGAT